MTKDQRVEHMISIIVLAAGLSSRFKGNKMIHKIDGVPMIRKVVKICLGSQAMETIVVVGHEALKIIEQLNDFNCKIVENTNYSEGQSSSVKEGIKKIDSRSNAVIILPGDVAFMTREIIDAVINHYKQFRSVITVASFEGISGHPILFDKSLFKEIMTISEKNFGLKEVVKSHKKFVAKVECGTNEVLLDIDSSEDLMKRGTKFEKSHN